MSENEAARSEDAVAGASDIQHDDIAAEDIAAEDEYDAGLWTVPNLITIVRIAALPVFVWLLFSRENRAAAAYTLAAIGGTDWVDGWAARKYNQVSNVGKILDPVADRLVLFVGIICVLIDGSAPLWVSVLVFAREILISVAVVGVAALGGARTDVTWVGKAGTFGNLVAFPMFLGGNSTLSYAPVLTVLAWCAVIPGLILSYYAGWSYVPLAREALQRGRSGRDEA